MPPLWQYFSCLLKKPLELICAPKGIGPQASRTFLLQKDNFWGAEEGAKGVDHGPLQGSCWRLCAR
jgi:hypothetical protein